MRGNMGDKEVIKMVYVDSHMLESIAMVMSDCNTHLKVGNIKLAKRDLQVTMRTFATVMKSTNLWNKDNFKY